MGSTLSAPLSAAGEAVATKMAEKQKEAMVAQRDMQRQNMEMQMKRQLAMQMAMTRERLNWQGAFWGEYAGPGVMVSGVGLRLLTRQPVPAAAIVPILVIPYIMAYQVDLAYGNKSDRIYHEANRIQEEEAHWFTAVKEEDSKKKFMW